MVRLALYTLFALYALPARAEGELVPAPPGAHCAAQFRRVTETFAGRKIPVIQVSGLEKKAGTRFGDEVAVEDILGTKNAVAIGLSQGHFYVYANGARHHGKLPVGEGLRDIRRNTNFVKDGVLITFPDMTPAEVEALRASLVAKAQTPRRTLSCVTSGYGALKEGTDLRLRGCGDLLPSSIVKKVLRGDFVRTNGQPVKIEVYRTNDLRFEDLHGQFRQMQNTLLVVSAVPGGIAGVVAWVYAREQQKGSPANSGGKAPGKKGSRRD